MPAITSRTLTESERTTIVNGLHVAAERFKAHFQSLQMDRCPNCQDRPGKDGLGRICKTCNGVGDIPTTKPEHVRLARQFSDQYSDSIKLAELIDGAESIEVRL
jgi:hypothetical protein